MWWRDVFCASIPDTRYIDYALLSSLFLFLFSVCLFVCLFLVEFVFIWEGLGRCFRSVLDTPLTQTFTCTRDEKIV